MHNDNHGGHHRTLYAPYGGHFSLDQCILQWHGHRYRDCCAFRWRTCLHLFVVEWSNQPDCNGALRRFLYGDGNGHEWLHSNGSVKKPAEQSPVLQDRRQRIREKLGEQSALERPILGIGLMDNVEIGAGRDILLTLAAEGLDKIPVHIPRSNLAEFRNFIKD